MSEVSSCNHVPSRVRKGDDLSELPDTSFLVQELRESESYEPVADRRPYSVHLAITNKCNLSCEYCYQERGEEQLSLTEIMSILAQVAQTGGRRIMISGGEPLLHGKILDIIAIARGYHLETYLSSNGTQMSPGLASRLQQAGIDKLHISTDAAGQTNDSQLDGQALLNATRCVQILIDSGISPAINLIVSRQNLAYLDSRIEELASLRVTCFNLLRPKPSCQIKWFESARLNRDHMYELQIKKMSIESAANVDFIDTDCSLHALAYGLPAKTVAEHYGNSCPAGRSLIHIDSKGDIYPCVHLHYPQFRLGNIKRDFLDILLHTSPVLEGFSRFSLRGGCQTCRIKEFCGGCRAIAFYDTGDEMAEDRDCPYLHRTEPEKARMLKKLQSSYMQWVRGRNEQTRRYDRKTHC